MPKVLRIINRFNLGGPTFNAALLTKHLAPEFETCLVGGMHGIEEGDSSFILKDLGLEPRYIKGLQRELNFKKDRAAYKEIKALIKEFKPDIVHTHASKAGAIGRLAASKCNVPVICHTFHGHVFHSYFGKAKTQFYKTVERRLAKRSSKIIAISEIQKEELTQIHRICDADKVSVIPLGFDLSRFQSNQESKRKEFRSTYGIEESEFAISIIGRLVPIKDHALFLNAIAELNIPNLRVFIVGDGECRNELEELCSSLKLDYSSGDRPSLITFTSWIKEVDKVLAGSDLIALSSLNEGTPVTLIEAQAAGKPIVTTNVGGIKDIVIPGQTALISESRELQDFANLLRKAITNDGLRQSAASLGPDHAIQKFNYTRLASDMAELYNSLLNQIGKR